MQFASLGSGSRGNGTLVESGNTLVMLDCGFSCRETERRMARLGRSPDQLDALLVTHEHGDHVRGIAPLARKYRLPVWLTRGTWQTLRDQDLPEVQHFEAHDLFSVADLQVQPFTVPHDAREPCQFSFGDGTRRLGVLTDTGRMTPHIVEQLDACDALLLECNHDAAILANGPYSAALKQRVGGPLGHLSNSQAATLLAQLDQSRLQHVVAAHLSEQNNRPALARAALADTLDCEHDWVGIADQQQGLDWRTIS
ncbi:MAG: MBL fold metallo-hydrolase [Gammaproteobacteria bacterium]|nr:MBL fold metallo-hydrolase [Gammaproteobacteria bacterium]